MNWEPVELEIDLNSNPDRRELMDRISAHYQIERKRHSTISDLIDVVMKNEIRFSGEFRKPYYYFSIFLDTPPVEMDPEGQISNPNGIPPNINIGETDQDMINAFKALESPEEMQEIRIAKKASEAKNDDIITELE